MILYPNAKINIGLEILRKRKDGFHDLESIFYPLQLCDILEINKAGEFHFSQSGITIDGNPNDNLVVKAYRLLQKDFGLSGAAIHLHKQIPFGAGLGGGSSDAAFLLKGINELFSLNLSLTELENYAAKLGCDCPFFILNEAAIATGRGEVLTPCQINLEGHTLLLVKPDCSVSTAEAYADIKPMMADKSLSQQIDSPISSWKNNITNRFETSVFKKYPIIEDAKTRMYNLGAVYASMSGSGSSVFGLFSSEIDVPESYFGGALLWKERCLY
jgi:4-diphosphocytidyl-2-C-methyl-D-erythritol kinase